MTKQNRALLRACFSFLLISTVLTDRATASTQTGLASYYGAELHGHRTASGVRFNRHDLTAAHRSLPFGTRLKVTNLANGRSVVLRINDRGPFVHRRILDVSEAAARQLGFIGRGFTKVKLETL